MTMRVVMRNGMWVVWVVWVVWLEWRGGRKREEEERGVKQMVEKRARMQRGGLSGGGWRGSVCPCRVVWNVRNV